MRLSGKKILVGVTGSIAAYKAVEICRLLIKEGAGVRVIMTPPALDFVGPLTFSVVTGQPVYHSMIAHNSTWNNHVEAGLWADILLIAPATADTIAKMASGICDSMLLATYLSARCPVMVAPAMDRDMYMHPATQNNIRILKERQHIFIGPAHGELASGLMGEGRLVEPEAIVKEVNDFFFPSDELKGKTILVTAGPTRESIDPVRYISNRSSGRMGFALAHEMKRRGADVTLITGPTHLENPAGVKVIKVETADEMLNACMQLFNETDIAVMSAAVADFTPVENPKEKIKKSAATGNIMLKPTVDILAEMGRNKRSGQLLVGFALETNDGMTSAQQKLQNKNLDLIVLNSLEDKGAGFDTETNKVTLIDKSGTEPFSLKSKSAVAKDITDKIISIIHA